MRKFLIVGGAGFIGSNLAKRFHDQLDDVHLFIVDDLSLGRLENIDAIRKEITFIKQDFSNGGKVKRIFKRYGPFEKIFHLAANSDIQASSKDPNIEYWKTFMTTREILEAMRVYRTPEIYFCSTSAVYGDKGDVEIKEGSGPYLPISYYGGAKLASEGLVSSYSHMNNFKATILRFPNVVGPNATHGVIYDFVRKLFLNPRRLGILGDGMQTKSYIYVDDLIDVFIYLLQKDYEKVRIFNIGTEGTTSVNEIASMVIEEMKLDGVRLDYSGGSIGWKGDIPKFRYNLEKIHTEGWRAKFSSNEAIRLAIRKVIQECKQ